MDPQHWTRIEALYHAALARQPDERSAYLAEACAGEPELRREIESLLACAGGELKGPVANGEKWPSGFRLGSYEIVAPLGAGGMGEVYRARDTKLRREVAIKTLPREFQTDPGRLARFEREAQVLASLNHFGIASIYGVEEQALVMEFVPGPTLADRIALERISVEETHDIIRQLADALEYAHDRGVVHRDLKPANIKLDPDGKVKILDFGLATIVEEAASEADDRAAGSTSKTDATVVGTILGTPPYMAPEQARGKKVDKRADIWAFGVIAWEMLTGELLFQGKDAAEILNKVVSQPIEFERVSGRFRRLLERCLDRNPKDRLRDIGEARFLLPEGSSLARPQGSAQFAWITAAVLAVITLVLAVYLFKAPAARSLRTTIIPPEKTTFAFSTNYGPMQLSPNGQRIVFAASKEDGTSELWVRALDAVTGERLPGTQGATFPFWSPDNRWVAFFADGRLKKIDTQSRAIFTLGEAPAARGGAWSPKDMIVFTPIGPSYLLKVSAAGGKPAPATVLDATVGAYHRFPWFLPDGEHFLFEAQKPTGGRLNLAVGSLDSTSSQVIGEADSNAVYAEGRLLYLRGSALMAQPFDPSARRFTGEAVQLTPFVDSFLSPNSVGMFSVSTNGLLAYQAGDGSSEALQLAWFDRTGRPQETLWEPKKLASLELSPNRQMLMTAWTDPFSNTDLWIYDLLRHLPTHFTFDQATESNAVWSPDGQTIVFDSTRKGHYDLYRKAANNSSAEELVYADDSEKQPDSWSPDGKFLLYHTFQGPGGIHIWVLPMAAPQSDPPPVPRRLFQTTGSELFGQFSPDGRWVLYASKESQATYEIYLAPFSRPSEKHQISSGGGLRPRWRQDGKEIFYHTRDGQLLSVKVRISGDTVELGVPQPLFGGIPALNGYAWDLSANGQRILAAIPPKDQKPYEPITLVQNWSAGLKK
jgi:Tol biopolymer transport system component/predicted Ser/Thr protein kinase